MQLLQRTIFRIALSLVLSASIWPPHIAATQEVKFPQLIQIRYEAVDPQAGGQFLIWVEREKIWYGLDPRLYPPAKFVEVTTITPAPGSTSLTMIAVTRINSAIPDYFHLSGNVRFKVSGMTIKSSNMP